MAHRSCALGTSTLSGQTGTERAHSEQAEKRHDGAPPSRGYISRAQRTDWNTPSEIVEPLRLLWDGPPDLDPCSNPSSLVAARREVMLPEDGLVVPWTGRVYVNPPFDALATWAAACARARREHGAEVVLLTPARVDTRWWHREVPSASAVCFWKGRLRFVGAEASSPFPTALVYWGPRPWDFHRVFATKGMVVHP